MSKLIVMMGVPGSGKSTWVKNNLTQRDIWVSRDAIRYSLLDEDDDYFAKEDEVIKTFIQGINDMLQKGFRYVYADATHLHPKGRAQLLNGLTVKPDAIYVAYLDVPLETILIRNAQRTGRALVPEKVVKRMYNSISLPTKEEGVDAIFFINKDGIIETGRTQVLKEG